ncbi:deoxyribose-phosphate aldolase [Rarobacter faecitabidus]
MCISPSQLPIEVPPRLKVATVCGFPSGAVRAEIKGAEAALAVRQGADEVDMVINLGAAKSGDWVLVAGEIGRVRRDIDEAAAQRGAVVILKVIIESAALSDDEIVKACEATRDSGANFVKTSTGFHPAGGASLHAVELMAKTVGDQLGIKASGGIRTWHDAVAMIDAGATRLGVSATRAILAGGTPGGEGGDGGY